MDRNFCKAPAPQPAGASPPSAAWFFAQALLGKPVPSPSSAQVDARARREHLEWLAAISTEHERQLRRHLSAEADARAQRRQLEWLAQISTEHEAKLRTLLREEADAREAHDRCERFNEAYPARIAEWDEADHPRRGYGPHPGAWVGKGGAGGSSGSSKSPSFFDAIIRRNQTIAELTGIITPGMIRSTRIAMELQSAAQLPGEIARAAAAGLLTGGKALINGSATAIKSVASLGFNTSQIELIGVTKEDRANGYDTAVAISTASGQVLIAVGTGGMASALSKGGSIARTASGALVAFDAAGNAVGVVQGAYDASQNGVSISNGAQVAGGLLGLSANAMAARGLRSASGGNVPEGPLPKGFDPVKGFATFDEFKDAFGAAGSGQAWHHVVEQTVNSGKFAAELLHNPANLLKLPHGKGTIHAKISGYYSSKIPGLTGNMTVREWLSKKSLKEQFTFGIEAIKKAGGSQYLPPHLR